MNKRRYEKEYRQWLNSKPVCECGCGELIKSDYRVFVTAYLRYGQPPRFASKHQYRVMGVLKEKHTKQTITNKDLYVSFNGCNIKILNEDRRCEDFKSCPEYLKCLEFVVVSHKARGWERIYPEKENI